MIQFLNLLLKCFYINCRGSLTDFFNIPRTTSISNSYKPGFSETSYVLYTLQLHYNAVLYNAVLYNVDSIITRSPRGSQIFFQYNVWKCQQTIAVYTMRTVKIVLPVYFLAKFATSWSPPRRCQRVTQYTMLT